MGCRVCIY